MSRSKIDVEMPSRRAFLKNLGVAPLLLRAAPFSGFSSFAAAGTLAGQHQFPFADLRLSPRYPAKTPLEAMLRRVPPGSDEYVTEKYASDIGMVLAKWSAGLKSNLGDFPEITQSLSSSLQSSSLKPESQIVLRPGPGIAVTKRRFSGQTSRRSTDIATELREYLAVFKQIEVAEFEIVSMDAVPGVPLTVRIQVRYDLVALRKDDRREERVGSWAMDWVEEQDSQWKLLRWQAGEETAAIAQQLCFIDVTEAALGREESYRNQLLHGVDHWRTVLDGASGIDVYGNNGIAAGDFNNDGLDDLYVSQPAGLPNRLYRNRGDGSFDDVTEKAGVGVLDGTACALFADFDNSGLQDLLVVCGTGPLLFKNQGDGTFSLKRGAFQFKTPPQGTFTHAALADYDRDGRLDIYFCLYSYYVGLDQYHYPVPYYDARNGPPNYLLHNEGNGTFVDRTESSGLNAENDRYSFACAWGSCSEAGAPDLYVANDFGHANLYRNNGNGTFTAISAESHTQDAGAGMSATWASVSNDGKLDIYAANMWSAAGQRISSQPVFHEKAAEGTRLLYQRHAQGNALYKNHGKQKFENVSQSSGVAMGRWSWCSDFWDFDHDGYADLYVTNGYITASTSSDLSSFFWRQVVGNSPDDSTPAAAYEHGWQALNELIRSDHSWNGSERNVMYANNRDGTFSEVSGVTGLDFLEDSRSFALADLDQDGRLEVIVKNRSSPQIRVLHNAMREIGDGISFRLRGISSNRDAIGACIVLESGSLKQTKYLQAGSGFLAQHSKEVFFGLGKESGAVKATVLWPAGSKQVFEGVPANHRIEVLEGTAKFEAKPFSATPNAYSQVRPAPLAEKLPPAVESWLVDPLKAPGFSLPDLQGNLHSLESFAGSRVLLTFWQAGSETCLEQLRLLQKNRTSLDAVRLKILAINADLPMDVAKAKAFASQASPSFPVLFATEELAGIYNIIYRYLFDRHRDLPLPSSFLLDAQGMIVKLYQGNAAVSHILEDVKELTSTGAKQKQRGIPFHGTFYQGSFQRNDFTYGVAMFQHGYLEQAAESFRQVVAAKPDDPEAYYNLGTLSLRRNSLKDARSYLEQTVKLRPNYPEAWNNLGMIAAQEGQAVEAIEKFQQSLALRPNYAIALLNLGNVYRRQGEAAKAEESLKRALELQPDDPEILYSLGMYFAQQGDMHQAADHLRRAIDLRPDYPEALNNLGVLFVREHDFARAATQFKTCIQLVPQFDQSYLNLARLYAMQSDTVQAKQVLTELLQLQPGNKAALQAMDSLH